MFIAAIHPFPMADTTNQQQQQQRLPLRRAVYVHVSDLTNAYNIDHPKLEKELARVREGNEENSIPEEREIAIDLAPGGDGDSSIASVPQQLRRRSLHPPRKGFNLCVLVGSVKVVVDKLRVDRSQVRLAEVEVGDETGTVSLRARDDQIEVLKEISERSGAVVLRNCSVELFQGKHVRIAVTKWGKLTPYPDQVASTPPPPSKINRDRNFSLIDMSLVASELMEMSPSEAAFSPQSQHRLVENDGVGNNRAARPQPPRQQMQQNRQDRKVSARDRRQQHPKPTGMNLPRAMLYPESGMQGHVGGMRYSGIPNYTPSFGEGHPHQASTQHLLMQQYEMHQRQLHQMQAFHEQQERNRPRMQRHHQQGHQMQGSMLGAASFDTTGDYSVSSPVLGPGNPQQSMHLVGNNPMLIRVSMQGQPSMGATGQPDHYGSMSGAVMPTQDAGMPQSSSITGGRPEAFRPYRNPSGSAHLGAFVSTQVDAEGAATDAWGTPTAPEFVSQDDVSLSSVHMNPQATAFAPTYQDPRGEQQQMQSPAYGYVPFDPAGTMYSAPQAPMYSQNVMYFPMAGTTGSTTPSEISPNVAASPSDSKGDHDAAPQAAPQDAPRKS